MGVGMKRILTAVVGMLLLGSLTPVRADVPPNVLVENTVQEVMTMIKQEKGDKKKIRVLVDERVLPLFDFTLITKRAVGPSWKTATPEQRKILVDEFRSLLVRAFIDKAFSNVGNHSVKFEPGKYAEGDDQVTVRTFVVTPGEESLPVDYDLKKTSAGWKVVDLAIAGPRVALDIYSNQFREPLQQAGVDGLIKFLMEKNQAAEKPTNKAAAK
jgi:phospholipid transport system substrate-binding protein